jgi:hypothetical protein
LATAPSCRQDRPDGEKIDLPSPSNNTFVIADDYERLCFGKIEAGAVDQDGRSLGYS